MAAINYPIVGPPRANPAPVDGSVPLRLEVRELQKNADQWNLYLLGLEAFKNVDEKSDLSYYGIAGIHGRPYRPWGGVKGANAGGWQGYCTHTDILFAPWHRPYLSLFEQVLFGHVQDIASQFPAATRARYQAAASKFRIPYWDWAAQPDAGDFFPDSVGGSATVSVITPTSNGQKVTIANPLYSTKFKPINPVPGDFPSSPENRWPETLRYPTSSSASAKSQQQQVFQAMSSQFAGIQQNVDILLNDPSYKDFAVFSNHEFNNTSPNTFASIEDIHNGIHVAVGGDGGHMSGLDYSAFDPVFWLHHANVDRLFAIWQALNPDSYTIDKRSGRGTFAIKSNSVERATTGLAPFSDSTGQAYWTSEGARNTSTFNYAYPETQQWNFANVTDYQNDILNTVQRLYSGLTQEFTAATNVNLMAAPALGAQRVVATNGNGPAPAAAAIEKPSLQSKISNKIKAAVRPDHSITTSPVLARILDSKPEQTRGTPTVPDAHDNMPRASQSSDAELKSSSYTQYIVNIKATKHILHQTYKVNIFLGDFAPETDTWHTQDALVGTFVSFGKDTEPGSPTETGCGKCKKDAESGCIITGTIPLTAQILAEIKKGNCPSLDKESVLPYLTRNLHWRVTLADGTEKSRNEVPGLVISVVSTEVHVPAGGRAVYSGVYELHPEVTVGRPAGYNAPGP